MYNRVVLDVTKLRPHRWWYYHNNARLMIHSEGKKGGKRGLLLHTKTIFVAVAWLLAYECRFRHKYAASGYRFCVTGDLPTTHFAWMLILWKSRNRVCLEYLGEVRESSEYQILKLFAFQLPFMKSSSTILSQLNYAASQNCLRKAPLVWTAKAIESVNKSRVIVKGTEFFQVTMISRTDLSATLITNTHSRWKTNTSQSLFNFQGCAYVLKGPP